MPEKMRNGSKNRPVVNFPPFFSKITLITTQVAIACHLGKMGREKPREVEEGPPRLGPIGHPPEHSIFCAMKTLREQGNIGWGSVYVLVISRVIGSGIFATPGTIIQNVGSPGLALYHGASVELNTIQLVTLYYDMKDKTKVPV
jgi:hypothetical protein